MKQKRYLLIGLVFGTIIGWAMGFLRLPLIEKNYSFWVGFVAALSLVSLVLLLLSARNTNFLLGRIGEKSVAGYSTGALAPTFIWIILTGVLVSGGVMGGLTVYRQYGSFKLQIHHQDKRLQEMAALLESLKKTDLEPLMHSILDDVREELKRSPDRTLRDTTIARIASLSFAFKPYKYVEGDSLSKKAYSPGRGQLLQALVLMKIDSGSFNLIKLKTVFTGADLHGADLKGINLTGINLKEANLKDADLSGSNLKGAFLGEANFWGAKLNQANLSHTDLKRADLSWAQLNQAILTLANLNGANLTNAQLLKVDLTNATLQWSQLGGALFNEANLKSVNLLGANLSNVNLSQANLRETDLRLINLSEADLLGATLDNALVDEKWLEKLNQWRPAGVKELQERYSVVNDTFSAIDKRPLYRLRKN
jgi:uncharacterized protein YjbI with pentapeptide repeats